MSAGSTIIPSLRYRDAIAAIDWLVRAFGFEGQAVYPGPDNTVAHAQLTLGSTGMIMLGSLESTGKGARFMAKPDETDFQETQGIYLVVPDADAIYASAKAAGAEIVLELRDVEYGGRAFSCRDLEGHLWHIGTFDPWQKEAF